MLLRLFYHFLVKFQIILLFSRSDITPQMAFMRISTILGVIKLLTIFLCYKVLFPIIKVIKIILEK